MDDDMRAYYELLEDDRRYRYDDYESDYDNGYDEEEHSDYQHRVNELITENERLRR